MQISMELLSQMITRAGSGSDTRQKTSATTGNDSLFSDALDKSRESMNYDSIGNTDKTQYEKDVEPNIPNKPDEMTVEDEDLAAGVLGYQNMVVFILEGDKESATTPEIGVGAITVVGEESIEYALPQVEIESDNTDAKAQKTDANVQEPEITAHDVKNAVDAETNAAGAGNEANSAAGEVTARMPETRTSERDIEEDNSEFLKNGGLSPLENENDAVPVKGQKENSHSDTYGNANDESGDAQELMVNNQVLLTEDIKPERFQADQQMKQTADVPVRTENLFDEMVSRIETMNAENRQTVTIQLKPEFLGKVALEIAMDAAGLHVKIDAADSSVRGMINGQINALLESLSSKGIEVVEVEVAYTGVDNGAFKDSHNNQAQPDRPRRPYRMDKIEDGAAYYAALPFDTLEYYLEAGVSSVEYSA